jgi:hypothetical protein
MKGYITRDGIPGKLEFQMPESRPKPGDIYEWTISVKTAGGTIYEPGDTLELLELTSDSPHGYHCSSGNWRVRGKTGVSVWTTIEDGISQGYLRKVAPIKNLWERLQD